MLIPQSEPNLWLIQETAARCAVLFNFFSSHPRTGFDSVTFTWGNGVIFTPRQVERADIEGGYADSFPL